MTETVAHRATLRRRAETLCGRSIQGRLVVRTMYDTTCEDCHIVMLWEKMHVMADQRQKKEKNHV